MKKNAKDYQDDAIFMLQQANTYFLSRDPYNQLFYLENHMVTYAGIDSSTNIVRTLGMANLPKSFKRKCGIAWQKAFEMGQEHDERFMRWVQDMDSRYSIMQLWQRAEKLGFLGEA